MKSYNTTIQFREHKNYVKLKLIAVVNEMPIGPLLELMVERELEQFAKAEIEKTLKNHPNREKLLATW